MEVCEEVKWCPGADLNHRHEDFQSTALPLSYPGTGRRFGVVGRGCLGQVSASVQSKFQLIRTDPALVRRIVMPRLSRGCR